MSENVKRVEIFAILFVLMAASGIAVSADSASDASNLSYANTTGNALNTNVSLSSSSNTIYVPDDYPMIQIAVVKARPGDTIIVRDGIYTENIDVYKNLGIISENGPANCVVHAANSNDHVFEITANDVDIRGFTVNGATEWWTAGIHLRDAWDCRITDNIVSNNWYGICLLGSGGNTITNNLASYNYQGISLNWSSYNWFANNIASNNNFGILMEDSSDNTIVNNIANSNNYNGIYLDSSDNNEIYLNNFINNNDNVYSYYSTNIWNSPTERTYPYNGKRFTNYLGNYWDDYTGVDWNGDGIGDSPYNIEDYGGDEDNYPLVKPWENYYLPTRLSVHNLNTKEDFPWIQAAIDDHYTLDGHTIIVDTGTYNESVHVYKSLTIRSASGNPEDTIIKAVYPDDPVFNVTADYVNISGFTVTGAIVWKKAGIYLGSVDYCNITNNIVSDNDRGIYLRSSNNNVIRNNIISDNRDGISLISSINNTLINNIFVNDGLDIWDSCKNTVENNTVNDRPLVYLENISDYRISDAGQVVLVNCNNITAENLELTNTSTGIALLGTNNSKIINNNCTNNEGGIDLDKSCNNTIRNNIMFNMEREGMWLDSSNNNKIANNNVSNTGYGIVLVWYSNNSVIRNNIISNNELDGIYIGSSINNTLINNTFVNDGLEIWDSYKNTVENNTVNDKPLVYLENVSDYNITDAGQVILVNCNNITAENLELTNTSTGIALLGTNNSKIINNNCSNNEGGIDLDKSCNNTIMNNIVSKNDRYGICVDFSTNNLIYLNNFISNAENVYSYGLAKFWNSSEKINYSYNNSQHTNCLGNYWDDYTGSDVVGDGIGDVPYIIDYLNKDNYPLVEPQENYIISTTTRRNAK